MRYLPFFLFALIALDYASCNKDPCQEQYCLNGGDCLDGDCLCPTGWTGEHCDEATFTTPAYDCDNGNCITDPGGIYTSLSDCQDNCGSSGGNPEYNCTNGNCITATNGTYNTLTACQNACGSSGGNTGYNCSNGNCITATNGAYNTLVACQNSCGSNNQTNLEFQNNAFTDISITVDGISKIIPLGQSVIFTGEPNTAVQVTASTSGETSQGNTVGLVISWNLSRVFPNTGTTSNNLNVSADYFLLRIRNQGSTNLNDLYVNYGLTSQTLDNIIIPNDGVTYRIGYYRAWSNSNVRAYRPNGSDYVFWNQGNHFTLPFAVNQQVTLNAN